MQVHAAMHETRSEVFSTITREKARRAIFGELSFSLAPRFRLSGSNEQVFRALHRRAKGLPGFHGPRADLLLPLSSSRIIRDSHVMSVEVESYVKS
jgi:hypothetical protein